MSAVSTERSKIAHAIRVLALPIVLGWLVLTVATNVFVPSLEKVGEANTVSMNAHDAPAFIAMQRVGANFRSSTPTATQWSFSRGTSLSLLTRTTTTTS